MLAPEHIAWGREFARRREAARRTAWERQAQRASGVCWSGAGPGAFAPATEAALEREALQWARIRHEQAARAPAPPFAAE